MESSSSHEAEDPRPDSPAALVLQREVHRHREEHRDQRLHQQRREVPGRRDGVLPRVAFSVQFLKDCNTLSMVYSGCRSLKTANLKKSFMYARQQCRELPGTDI